MDTTNTVSRLPLLAALLACALGCRSTDTTATDAASPAPTDPETSITEPAEGPELSTPEEIVLVRVDGVGLTLADAMKSFEGSHGGHSVLVRGEPAVRELVGRLVEHQVLIAEALALGADRNEEVIAFLEERRLLLSEGLFWTREVDEKVEVDEADVEAYYIKTEMVLSVTLIETTEREACEALRARVEAGESMAELAAGESIHSSRPSGGLLPFVQRGDLEPALDGPIFALEEEGDMTAVVATESGFAFARLDTRTINEERPEREVMLPQIRRILKEEAGRELRREVEQRVREEAGVEIDAELAVAEVVLDTDRDRATVVARSAGEELTLGELQDYLDIERLRREPPERAAEVVESLVQEWTDRKAVRSAAIELGLPDDPQIQSQVEAYTEDVLMAFLLGEYVYADIEVTEADARAYYDEHVEDSYTRPPRARIAYLVVATREEADDALRRLEAGEPFGDLARELSLDVTAKAHGGRIGWVTRGELAEEVEGPVLAAEPDSIVGPIETGSGWFVVDVMECTPAMPIPFEAVRPRARDAVESARRTEAYGLWVSRLSERADVEIDEPGIQEAVAWLEVEAKRLEEEKARRDPAPTPHGEASLPAPPTAEPDDEMPGEASPGAQPPGEDPK